MKLSEVPFTRASRAAVLAAAATDLFLRSHSNDKKSVLRQLLDDNVASVSRAPEALLAG